MVVLQVLIHTPEYFPFVISQGFAVGLGEEGYVSVDAQQIQRYTIVAHEIRLYLLKALIKCPR